MIELTENREIPPYAWLNPDDDHKATLSEIGLLKYCLEHCSSSTHPTSAVLSDACYFAKRVTLSLALRSSGDAGRGFGRVGAAAALVAG